MGKNTNDRVHVFVGQFSNRELACEYSEPQWEPEPDDSVSDEDYSEWEDRNPSWQMKADLGLQYLDSDFIETIDDPDRFEYLSQFLTEPDAMQRIQAQVHPGQNILILVFSEAFGGFATPPLKSTPQLHYCGEFACQLPK